MGKGETMKEKQKENLGQKNNKSVHVFVLLVVLIMLGSLLTYLIPAGEFQRLEDAKSGQKLVVAHSYRHISNNPIPLHQLPAYFFKALIKESTAKLIFFILIVGGSFHIIASTKALDVFFTHLIKRQSSNKKMVIPLFIGLFSIFGFSMGLTTASIVFVPLGIMIARALGYGTLTGVAMVTLGVNAGFAAGVFNPFSVGIAQTIAEVPLFSGIWIRWVLLIILLPLTGYYVFHFAETKDKLLEEKDSNEGKWQAIDIAELEKPMTGKEIGVIILFILVFIWITVGIVKYQGDVGQMATTFLVAGVIIGKWFGYSFYEICELFVQGAQKMTKGILVIGLAATLRLVLTEGYILDTIALAFIHISEDYPDWAKLIGLFYGNAAFNLLVTSGSAQAAIVMPIMMPIGDYLGFTRSMMVLMFQLGDGLTNLVSPLSTTLTGVLAVSGVTYQKWFKFFMPLVALYMIVGTMVTFLAYVVGY